MAKKLHRQPLKLKYRNHADRLRRKKLVEGSDGMKFAATQALLTALCQCRFSEECTRREEPTRSICRGGESRIRIQAGVTRTTALLTISDLSSKSRFCGSQIQVPSGCFSNPLSINPCIPLYPILFHELLARLIGQPATEPHEIDFDAVSLGHAQILSPSTCECHQTPGNRPGCFE
jgi:hypothetical protein